VTSMAMMVLKPRRASTLEGAVLGLGLRVLDLGFEIQGSRFEI